MKNTVQIVSNVGGVREDAELKLSDAAYSMKIDPSAIDIMTHVALYAVQKRTVAGVRQVVTVSVNRKSGDSDRPYRLGSVVVVRLHSATPDNGGTGSVGVILYNRLFVTPELAGGEFVRLVKRLELGL